MKTPAEKYRNDPDYHRFVATIEQMIEQAQFTPSELREMCMLACINYEMRHVRNINPKVEQAFKIFDDFVHTPRKRM